MRLFATLLLLPLFAHATDLPQHPTDLAAIQKIATHEGLDAAPEINPTKGWPNAKGEKAVRFTATGGKKDVRLGNLCQTMFGVIGVKVPDNFQGGEADGVINELV